MDWFYLLYIVFGYLLGSIPFALVIGVVFYHTDVRQHGSGNLGGSNTGRVLGKTAGMIVILCDVLKVVIAVGCVSYFSLSGGIWAGVAAAIGHCYPIFAKFHGGKAVATMFGFLLSTSIFTFQNAWYVLIPFIFFMIFLKLFKMVSLASIIAALSSSIYITIMNAPIEIILASYILTLVVIFRHRTNIKQIINNQERKVSWL